MLIFLFLRLKFHGQQMTGSLSEVLNSWSHPRTTGSNLHFNKISKVTHVHTEVWETLIWRIVKAKPFIPCLPSSSSSLFPSHPSDPVHVPCHAGWQSFWDKLLFSYICTHCSILVVLSHIHLIIHPVNSSIQLTFLFEARPFLPSQAELESFSSCLQGSNLRVFKLYYSYFPLYCGCFEIRNCILLNSTVLSSNILGRKKEVNRCFMSAG